MCNKRVGLVLGVFGQGRRRWRKETWLKQPGLSRDTEPQMNTALSGKALITQLASQARKIQRINLSEVL